MSQSVATAAEYQATMHHGHINVLTAQGVCFI